MLSWQRVIFSDNSVLSDISVNMDDFEAGIETLPIVAAQDYLFIGSDLPFNHRYIVVSTANDVASTTGIDYWTGSEWKACVDVIDQTAISGKTLAQSGFLRWSIDTTTGNWGREQNSKDVTGLAGTNIFNLYWIRLKFSVNLKTTTALKFIGHKFSTDSQLFTHYPDLNRSALMTSFKAGKTNWDDQEFMAARFIINDLKARGVILSANQILDYDTFMEPSIHRTAMTIFAGLGEAYKEHVAAALKAYDKSMEKINFNTDVDGDAVLSDTDKSYSLRFMSR
jgi:hypothetical protein